MKFLAVILFLLAATTIGAQTANVIELEPADAAKAQKAYAELQAAQLIWDSTQEYIARKYTGSQPKNCLSSINGVMSPASCGSNGIRDFENGIEFSKDFKYIVPKQSCSGCGTVTSWPSSIYDNNVLTTHPNCDTDAQGNLTCH